MQQRVVVIGLGIFGFNIVRELYAGGFEVIAIDKNKEAVQRVRDCSTKAIQADGTDKEIMEAIGIQEDDVVIISFGEDLAAATLTTLHLKQMKVKTIIVKAPNEEHKLILEKVGATEVMIPEKEIAHKVAKSLISPERPRLSAPFGRLHDLRDGTAQQLSRQVHRPAPASEPVPHRGDRDPGHRFRQDPTWFPGRTSSSRTGRCSSWSARKRTSSRSHSSFSISR